LTSTSPEILRLLQIQGSATEADSIFQVLTQAGNTVDALRVQTAAEFIDALCAPRWDVVVSDCRLASFDAMTALAILKATNHDVPFIVVSGPVREGVALMRAGAHDFLTKEQIEQLPYAVAREIRSARGRRMKHQAAEAEQQSRDRVMLAMEATRVGVFDYSPQTDRLVLSGPLKELYGISPESGCSWKVFLRKIHPQERALVMHAVIAAMRSDGDGRFFGEHRTIGHGDGWPRSMIVWGTVIFNEERKPVRFLGAARDITGPKRVAESLQSQLQLTQRITQQSADAIFALDGEGFVTYANPEAEAVFGFTVAEFTGQRLHDLVHHHHPDGRIYPFSECPNGRAVKHHQVIHGHEDVFFHKDGTPIYVSCFSGPLAIEGMRSGAVLTVRNITGRKRADSALRESEARYRCLEEAGIVGTMIANERAIVQANDHLIGMLGYTREEFAARNFGYLEITAPEFREAAEANFHNTLESGAVAPYEEKMLRKDGARIPVMVGAVAIDHAGQRCMFGFVVDQSRLKNLEEQLHRAQRLESVGRLAGGIAHDFNNLLTIILGYVEMMSSEPALNETAPGVSAGPRMKSGIDNIARAAAHAKELTGQLLTFGRQKPAEAQLLRIDQVIREVEQMLLRLIGEDIEIVLELGAADSCVHAEPGQIAQVLMNLATNARDAMPEGGELSIGTSLLHVDEFAALCFLAAPGHYIQLVVSDTGAGMTPEVAARIFDPFFTTKETGKGTGLGLATVYGIVKQSGGSVSVHSVPGLGSTFRILLPLVQGENASGSGPADEIALEGRETILLVEDQPVVRGYVSEVLARRGYRVIEAHDFGEAMARATHNAEAIDLLLTDFVLPGGNGGGLAREVGRFHPGVRIIVMSGNAERTRAHLGKDAPFLQKPFTAEGLLKLIRKVLDSRVPATSV
jgi:two-component system cell cycle sensor histidine kinase/response regulator CckA